MKNNRDMDDVRLFGLVWYGLVWFFWSVMVHGFCLDEIPCKILNSLFEKQQSYGQFKNIWFGLVWYGLVWFGLVWFGLV